MPRDAGGTLAHVKVSLAFEICAMERTDDADRESTRAAGTVGVCR